MSNVPHMLSVYIHKGSLGLTWSVKVPKLFNHAWVVASMTNTTKWAGSSFGVHDKL